MSDLLKLSAIASLVLQVTSVAAQIDNSESNDIDVVSYIEKYIAHKNVVKEQSVDSTDDMDEMFTKGKIASEIKSMNASNNQKSSAKTDIFATAVGGELKYASTQYRGFSVGTAMRASQNVQAATSDNKNQNNQPSSGDNTTLSEAYLNYKYKNLNFRAGRQVIETPLADSNPVGMIKNTFEAYVATYKRSNLTIIAGNIQNWQGYDAGLDDGWSKTGEDGTWFGGISYSDGLDYNFWYYNISKLTNALYSDVTINTKLNNLVSVAGGVQYLHESEIANSGKGANIYGAKAKISVDKIGLNLAYNRSKKQADMSSFSGFGGGMLYTSMDTKVIDEMCDNIDMDALVAEVNYDISDFTLLYNYGSVSGGRNSECVKANIVEQDMGVEYGLDDNLFASAVYSISSDEVSSAKTTSDWDRIQVSLVYTF